MDIFVNQLNTNIYFYVDILIKTLIAAALGGLIGLERESINRPAGFRTHILVCVGSALVMMTSEYVFDLYHGVANLDPARLGAQVISGIGFLGAGTIIRDGSTVKGLTTAASLWAVSCIGLAVGIGFYSGAIITSISVYLVLITLKNLTILNIEDSLMKKSKRRTSIKVELNKKEGKLGDIEKMLYESKVTIQGIKYLRETDETSIVKLFLVFETDKQYDEVITMLDDIDGVNRVVQY